VGRTPRKERGASDIVKGNCDTQEGICG
jgi:hypothetical protein